MDASQIFSEIYNQNRWNGGSGPGSDVGFCRPLVAWLVRFVQENGIRSVVDFGCGDFRWMPEVLDATGVHYLGFDVVQSLIRQHRANYPRWSFETLDVGTAHPSAVPAADLYWAKDVLQHWSNEQIETFLDRFFTARPSANLVVCNCTGQQSDRRRLDDCYRFAPLDGTRRPLAAYRPQLLYVWGGKHVYRLHQRSPMTDFPTSLLPPA